MNKQLFYLNDNVEFHNADETECIIWVFKWTGKCGQQISYSVDLHYLIENYYYEN